MNKRKALELLVEYLQEYSTNDCFYFHIKFIEELQSIVVQNAVGCEKEVFNIMIKQFDFVKTMGVRVNEADSNEILNSMGEEKAYYSLHIQNRIVNIRMLMAFTYEGIPVFLAAFYEKSGKKVSNYSRWVPIVKERLKQIQGGDCMVNKYCCDLNALLDIFEDNLSASDVLASKALAEISSGILQCRIESGMTQKQFAQFMNVSQGMVSKWESGDYNFSVKSLADIAVKLDLDLRVCLKKSKTVQMPEKERQFRHFTTNKRRFFVIHNCVPEKEKHSYVKQYVDDTDKIKILVK